jgi:hypothetical protein
MSDAFKELADVWRDITAPYTADPAELRQLREENERREAERLRQLRDARRNAARPAERLGRALGRAGVIKGRCRCCGATPTDTNPLLDYQHHPDCMVYGMSSCTCGAHGYLAHRYACPAPVDGKDCAPPEPN